MSLWDVKYKEENKMKKLLCKILACAVAVTALLSVTVTGAFAEADVIKVACVGDSITAGTNSTNYPMYLQELLGDGYEVKNFGLGGAAVNYKPESDGSYFWYGSTQYLSSLEYDADVVFVMMGTNDVSRSPLNLKKTFKEHYYDYLVKPYLDKGIEVVVMTSPTAYYYMMQDANKINTTIRDLQIELAEEHNLKLIDMNTATANMRECFPDGLHGNASGYSVIAQTVYKEYFGGKVGSVTVKTQPGALVSAGRIGIKANDETGEAVLPLLPGGHDLAVTLDGYKSVYGKLTVPEGNSRCEVAMSAGGKNVAVGSTVTASSVSGDNTPEKAADGNLDTRWQANWGASQWLQLDMGKVSKVGGVRLNWEPAYGKGYKVLVSSDGSNFTTVATITDGDGAVDEIFFDAVDAQYIKLEFTELGSQYGYSLYEVGVMESDGSPLTATDVNVTAELIPEAPSVWFYVGIGVGVVLGIAIFIVAVLVSKKRKAKGE